MEENRGIRLIIQNEIYPRVRGIPLAEGGELCGTIPACAGERSRWGMSGDWDYPRVCGGTFGLEYTLLAAKLWQNGIPD